MRTSNSTNVGASESMDDRARAGRGRGVSALLPPEPSDPTPARTTCIIEGVLVHRRAREFSAEDREELSRSARLAWQEPEIRETYVEAQRRSYEMGRKRSAGPVPLPKGWQPECGHIPSTRPVDRIVDSLGGATSLARHLGVSRWTVQAWQKFREIPDYYLPLIAGRLGCSEIALRHMLGKAAA